MGKGNVRYTEERASYCPQINMDYRSQTTREINKEKFLQNWRPKPPFENLHQMRKTVKRMEEQQKSPVFWHTIKKTIKRKSWAVWRGGIRLFLKEYEATGWLATWGSLNKSELAAKNGLNSNVYFTTVRVHVCISFFFLRISIWLTNLSTTLDWRKTATTCDSQRKADFESRLQCSQLCCMVEKYKTRQGFHRCKLGKMPPRSSLQTNSRSLRKQKLI